MYFSQTFYFCNFFFILSVSHKFTHISKKRNFCQKTLFFTTKNFWQNFVEKRGKIGEILQKFIFFSFIILIKSWLWEYDVKTFPKTFFEIFWPFSAITNEVKWKLPFWQHFFSSACIFGRKTIRPKIIFCSIYKYTQVFPKKFLVMWDKNWAIQTGSLGWEKKTLFFPLPFFPNPDFICFLRKAACIFL